MIYTFDAYKEHAKYDVCVRISHTMQISSKVDVYYRRCYVELTHV